MKKYVVLISIAAGLLMIGCAAPAAPLPAPTRTPKPRWTPTQVPATIVIPSLPTATNTPRPTITPLGVDWLDQGVVSLNQTCNSDADCAGFRVGTVTMCPEIDPTRIPSVQVWKSVKCDRGQCVAEQGLARNCAVLTAIAPKPTATTTPAPTATTQPIMPTAEPPRPAPTTAPTQPPAPRFPFALVSAGEKNPNCGTVYLKGSVQDSNGNPLSGVTVVVSFFGNKDYQVTDGNGQWGSAPLDNGDKTLLHSQFSFEVQIVESRSNPSPLSEPVKFEVNDCANVGQFTGIVFARH